MYNLTHDAFDHDYRAQVASCLCKSPFLGNSPLGPEFVMTKGFSLMFRRSAMEDVAEQFPYMQTFLSKAVFAASNAFYVNPVLMKGGSRIDAHVDCRLIVSENVRIVPNLVSIFYVSVRLASERGAIKLHMGECTEVSILPRSGDLLHFRGNLVHSVESLDDESERISLVCEQYNLPEDILAGFPDFEILLDADLSRRIPGTSSVP
jgi:hypothetical protein